MIFIYLSGSDSKISTDPDLSTDLSPFHKVFHCGAKVQSSSVPKLMKAKFSKRKFPQFSKPPEDCVPDFLTNHWTGPINFL